MGFHVLTCNFLGVKGLVHRSITVVYEDAQAESSRRLTFLLQGFSTDSFEDSRATCSCKTPYELKSKLLASSSIAPYNPF